MHAHAAFGLAEVMGEADEFAALGGVHGEIVEALAEPVPDRGLEVATRDFGPGMTLGQGEVSIAVDVLPGERDDPHIVVQPVFAVQVIERRDEFV